MLVNVCFSSMIMKTNSVGQFKCYPVGTPSFLKTRQQVLISRRCTISSMSATALCQWRTKEPKNLRQKRCDRLKMNCGIRQGTTEKLRQISTEWWKDRKISMKSLYNLSCLPQNFHLSLLPMALLMSQWRKRSTATKDHRLIFMTVDLL